MKEELLTVELVPSHVGTPEPPETIGALIPVPQEIRKQWMKNWERAFEEAQHDYDDLQSQLQAAYRVANRILRVEAPSNHEDARQIPDWQVMRREEVSYEDLPEHERKRIRKEFRREGGRYLEIYAIDGRQYFFELPEQSPSKGLA